jgi:hypothetical protein
MRYEITMPELKLKKRKRPAQSYTVESHVDASILLMGASKDLRLAVAKVDGVQVGCTIRRCNAEWTWDLLPPVQIARTLREFKS